MHGKGYSGHPPAGAAIDLVLLDPLRRRRIVTGHFPGAHIYRTDAHDSEAGWRILGWRMSDGSMPLGDYDAIDPDLAQFDYLPTPNASPDGHGPRPSGDGARDSHDGRC